MKKAVLLIMVGNLSLIAAIAFAALVYFVLMSFMKIEDADDLIAGLGREILKK